MESASCKVTSISGLSLVKEIEYRERIKRGWKDKDGTAQYEMEPLGWYVTFDNIVDEFSMKFSFEPPFKPGDKVKITIAKEPNANPGQAPIQ